LSFSDEVFDETIAAAGIPAAERQHRPFPVRTAPVAPELALKSQIFFAEIAAGDGAALKAEERGLVLLSRALRSIPGVRAKTAANSVRRSKLTRGLAVAAQEFIASRPFENWTLNNLAHDVGSSPYHLLRVFRGETGSTIHQYRMQLRLSAAARAILEGCDDLTGLALDLGFSSHSHFTDAFRRRFGIAPSALRGGISRTHRAHLRKNSTAIPSSIR
jgi:AraC-like DNA-binding protein